MKFESLIPNLMVINVNETIKYYEQNLGFTLIRTVPEKGITYDWAMMKRNEVVIMFQSLKSIDKENPVLNKIKPGGGVCLYIKVEGIHELYYDVVEKTEIISDIEKTFYDTTEFTIIDNNGYLITFSEIEK
jgi:uncharacterized glyoxalase superfamily protein PhnB